MAAQERLAYWFGSDEQQLQDHFRPQKAAVTAGDKPKGIGISWFSKSRNKTLPAVEDWASVLKTSANHFSRCNIWENQHGSEHSAN